MADFFLQDEALENQRDKPKYPVEIDWSHPIARGIHSAHIPQNSLTMNDLAGHFPPATPFIQSPTLKLSVLDGNRVIKSASTSSDGINLNAVQPALGVNDGFTWAVKYYNTDGNTTRLVFGNRFGGTSSPLQFVKITTNAFEYYNSGHNPGLFYPQPINQWNTLVITKIGADFKYYNNGVVVASGTTTITMDENPIYLLADNNESASGSAEWCYTWTRGLSDAEVKSFSKAPYQILKPATPNYFALNAGAITPSTFQAAWARNTNIMIQSGMVR